MHKLEFKATGAMERQRRMLRKRVHPIRYWSWQILIGTGVLAVAYNVTPTNLNEVMVGEQVAIIRDVSESMRGSEAKLQRQLAHLKASRGDLPEVRVNGLGISVAAGRSNLFNGVRTALERNPDLDAIYAYSDFEVINRPYWIIDSAGVDSLKRLLKEKRVRIYFSSIRYPPPAPYSSLARRSGGRIVPNK